MANKVIKWLSIPFIVILLMSHNVSAAEPNLVVYNPYSYTIGQVECAVQNGSITVSTGNTCVWGPNVGGDLQGRGLSFIATHTKFWVRTTSVYEVYVDVSVSTNAELMVPAVWDSFNSNGNFQLIIFEKVNNDNNIGSSATYEGYTSTYRFVLRPKTTAGIGIELGDNTRNNNWIYLVGDNWPVVVDTRITAITAYDIGGQPSNSDIVEAINDLKQSQQQQNQKEEQATENIENQTPSDMPSGDNSSATNLIGNITGIFNQIRDIPVGSSCSIAANFGNLDLGNLNLCTGKDKMPFIVNFGATVFQLVFVVSTGLILVRQVLNLYDWSRK